MNHRLKYYFLNLYWALLHLHCLKQANLALSSPFKPTFFWLTEHCKHEKWVGSSLRWCWSQGHESTSVFGHAAFWNKTDDESGSEVNTHKARDKTNKLCQCWGIRILKQISHKSHCLYSELLLLSLMLKTFSIPLHRSFSCLLVGSFRPRSLSIWSSLRGWCSRRRHWARSIIYWPKTFKGTRKR